MKHIFYCSNMCTKLKTILFDSPLVLSTTPQVKFSSTNWKTHAPIRGEWRMNCVWAAYDFQHLRFFVSSLCGGLNIGHAYIRQSAHGNTFDESLHRLRQNRGPAPRIPITPCIPITLYTCFTKHLSHTLHKCI